MIYLLLLVYYDGPCEIIYCGHVAEKALKLCELYNDNPNFKLIIYAGEERED